MSPLSKALCTHVWTMGVRPGLCTVCNGKKNALHALSDHTHACGMPTVRGVASFQGWSGTPYNPATLLGPVQSVLIRGVASFHRGGL